MAFCSKSPEILDYAGRVMRRTQAIAKHYAFHAKAKKPSA